MNDYEQFIEDINKKTGIDLSQYKEAQMKRRLTSLREKRGYNDFRKYFQALSEDKELYEEFLQRMTINVSEFYRNPKRWHVLEEQILPRLYHENRKLKVWSAACSTGEEPYTISMVLSKFLPLKNIHVLATDIDESILERARNGFYPESSVKEVPKPMMDTFMKKEGSGYRVSDDLKKTVTFRKHNLLSDRFETGFDLIICRNVLIYFTEEAKDQLYHKFNQSLRTGGTFFVGSTEQIFNPSRYGFETEDTFFYKKID
ncbi:CheR family methyltransferase [Texcoconibacillus texcoconensis]|uniref:protein-glutamate O-methyltransferase n=1 Tax=Texcoconibacillus texcoconensis TaxID=1095777 RepID=A0A840QNG7_9BACI|nr:protein-glutamate O-methyltransferase CheR [Texcoconibacillus texcoconensis]MBB5172890.1 chemotaxis protein methyltransferase CheR [Texcoconibacillus texcoconensis]